MAVNKEVLEMAKEVKQRRRRGGVFKREDYWWGSWTGEDGSRVRERLEARTYNDAVSERNAKQDRARQIRRTGRPAPATEPLRDYVEEFLNWQRPRQTPESWLRTKGVLDLDALTPLLSLPVHTIRREDIDKFATKRAAERSAGTIFKELGVVKKMLNWLVDEKGVLDRSPAKKYQPPCDVPNGRKRFLSRSQVAAVLKASPDWLRPIVRIAIYTGMRRGEILGLRWSMVDLRNKLITLPTTKNGDERMIPLNREALDVIRGQHGKDAASHDHVFTPSESGEEVAGDGGDNVSKAFKAVLQRLGIEGITFHDLRRTAGSFMRMKGADVLTIAEVLGHRDYRTTMIYQRADLEHRRKAVALLDGAYAPQKPSRKGKILVTK